MITIDTEPKRHISRDGGRLGNKIKRVLRTGVLMAPVAALAYVAEVPKAYADESGLGTGSRPGIDTSTLGVGKRPKTDESIPGAICIGTYQFTDLPLQEFTILTTSRGEDVASNNPKLANPGARTLFVLRPPQTSFTRETVASGNPDPRKVGMIFTKPEPGSPALGVAMDGRALVDLSIQYGLDAKLRGNSQYHLVQEIVYDVKGKDKLHGSPISFFVECHRDEIPSDIIQGKAVGTKIIEYIEKKREAASKPLGQR